MMHVIVHEGLVDTKFIAERTDGYEALQQERRGLQPRSDGAAVRHPGRDDPRSGAAVRDVEGLDDPVGHGHLAARPRHRQRALPHRAVADDRPDRPPRHRTASAARAEQRAGRVGLGPDPDDVSGLPARQQLRGAREDSSNSGERSLDHKPGLTVVEIMDAVHRGEITGMYIMGENPAMSDPDVAARAGGAGRARVAGRAGHLPHRDRRISPT